jgi:hypothetical protein
MKVVQSPEPLMVQSGTDVGIALILRYRIVEVHDVGYDLFSEEALERYRAQEHQ